MDKITKKIRLLLIFAYVILCLNCNFLASDDSQEKKGIFKKRPQKKSEGDKKENQLSQKKSKLLKKKKISKNSKKNFIKKKGKGKLRNIRPKIMTFDEAIKREPVLVQKEDAEKGNRPTYENLLKEGEKIFQSVKYVEEPGDNTLQIGNKYVVVDLEPSEIGMFQKFLNKHMKQLLELAILRALLTYEGLSRTQYLPEEGKEEANRINIENRLALEDAIKHLESHLFLVNMSKTRQLEKVLLAALKLILIEDNEEKESKEESIGLKEKLSNWWSGKSSKLDLEKLFKAAMKKNSELIKFLFNVQEADQTMSALIQICGYYLVKSDFFVYPDLFGANSAFCDDLITAASIKLTDKEQTKDALIIKAKKEEKELFTAGLNGVSVAFDEQKGWYTSAKNLFKKLSGKGFLTAAAITAAGLVGGSVGYDAYIAKKGGATLGEAAKAGVRASFERMKRAPGAVKELAQSGYNKVKEVSSKGVESVKSGVNKAVEYAKKRFSKGEIVDDVTELA